MGLNRGMQNRAFRLSLLALLPSLFWGMRAGAQDDIEKVFPIGTRLRILPNHACATAAQHGSYHVLRGADASRNWPRFTGW